MANTQIPGFIPVSRGGTTVECVRMRVLTNNTTAIFKGDALDNVSTGDAIVTATADGEVYSVQWGGASYWQASTGERLERKYLPATTLYTGTLNDEFDASYVYGVDDMVHTKFKASVDEAIVITDQGINYQMVLGTGSTTTGLSAHELDATSRGTTATHPWRVLEFVIGDPKSDPELADAAVFCKANAGKRDPALEPGGSLGT